MMNPETQTTQITYYQAREIILAMIRVALMDLNSSDPLQKKEAADWLISDGVSLAEEVKAEVGPGWILRYIHELERIGKVKRKERRFLGNNQRGRSYEQETII